MKSGLLFHTAAGLAVIASGCAAPGGTRTTTRDSVVSMLNEQAIAWNAGDIDRFMRSYWRSDELSFSSGGTVTRGWQATLDNYRTRYPNRDAMGKLTFSEIEVTPLGDAAALVLGRWHLARTNPVGGIFTLVLRKDVGGWKIIHDHTSRSES